MASWFSLSDSVNFWKSASRPGQLSAEETLAECMRCLQRWGGEAQYLAVDVVEVRFPFIRWTGFRLGPSNRFDGVRRAIFRVTETDLKIELSVQGETNALAPLTAAALAFSASRAIGWSLAVVSPAVGVAAAGLTWLSTWLSFHSSLRELGAHIQAFALKAGRLTSA